MGVRRPLAVATAWGMRARKRRVHTHAHALEAAFLLALQVTAVRMTHLEGNAYHARVHVEPSGGPRNALGPHSQVEFDARPSGAHAVGARPKEAGLPCPLMPSTSASLPS